jgi:hypothetical protein
MDETGMFRFLHIRGKAVDRDEALRLLEEGRVDEWNQGRSSAEEIPSLEKANLTGVNLSGLS